MHTYNIRAAALVLAVCGIAAAPSAPRHITPTVVMRKQADVIRTTLPDATEFFVKSVKVGQGDYRRLSEGGVRLDDQDVKFYYGKDASGTVRGIVLFPQINTQMHGPVEVGLTLDPDGTVRSVVTTKATVETKPWVQAAEASGILPRFVGMKPGASTERALQGVSKASVGNMPYYMAGQIAQAVSRGLMLYETLYASAQ